MQQTHALRFPTLTTPHPAERLVLLVLIALVVACISAYVYLIAASTFNIIARKQAEVASVQTQSALAQINAEYYQLSGQVTLSRAEAIGLTPIAKKDYVTRETRLGYARPATQ